MRTSSASETAAASASPASAIASTRSPSSAARSPESAGISRPSDAERLPAGAAAGEGARLQQVPLEVALRVGDLVEGEDGGPRAVVGEERLGAAQHVLGGEQVVPVDAAVRSAEGVHHLHGVGGERVLDQDAAARLAPRLRVLELAADLPGQPVELLAHLAVDLRLAGRVEQAEGDLRLVAGGELGRLQEGGAAAAASPGNRRSAACSAASRGSASPRRAALLGEQVEPPVLERAAGGRGGREELRRRVGRSPPGERRGRRRPGSGRPGPGAARRSSRVVGALLANYLGAGRRRPWRRQVLGSVGCCWRPGSCGRTTREAAGCGELIRTETVNSEETIRRRTARERALYVFMGLRSDQGWRLHGL